jgi:hypothetical protein
MYSLLHDLGFRRTLTAEAPSLLAAMIVAEVFYKFHSFSLECTAFLATWAALSYVAARMRRAVTGARAPGLE